MNSSKPLLTFLQVIWGPRYVQNYLDYTLATELSDENLTYFANRRAIYLILTREEDAVLIKKHPLYKRLCDIMMVDFFLIDSLLEKMSQPTTSKHSIFSAFQQIGCLLALRLKSSVAFLPADGIWGKSSLRRIGEIYESGYRSIFLLGVRITRESLILPMEQYRNADGSVSITNRSVAELSINSLHPQMKISFWNTKTPNSYPSLFIWQLDTSALLFRCFHLHPILVDYSYILSCKDSITNRTIDSEIIKCIYPEEKNIYIVDDSDDVMVATHSPADEDVLYDTVNTSYADKDILKQKLTANNIKYCHQYFSTKQIFIHSEELDRVKYCEIIEESNRTMWEMINY